MSHITRESDTEENEAWMEDMNRRQKEYIESKNAESGEVGEYEKDLAIRSLSAVVSKLDIENETLKAEIETRNSQLSNYVMLVAKSRDRVVELAKENEKLKASNRLQIADSVEEYRKENEDLKAKIRWIKNDARLKELGR